MPKNVEKIDCRKKTNWWMCRRVCVCVYKLRKAHFYYININNHNKHPMWKANKQQSNETEKNYGYAKKAWIHFGTIFFPCANKNQFQNWKILLQNLCNIQIAFFPLLSLARCVNDVMIVFLLVSLSLHFVYFIHKRFRFCIINMVWSDRCDWSFTFFCRWSLVGCQDRCCCCCCQMDLWTFNIYCWVSIQLAILVGFLSFHFTLNKASIDSKWFQWNENVENRK